MPTLLQVINQEDTTPGDAAAAAAASGGSGWTNPVSEGDSTDDRFETPGWDSAQRTQTNRLVQDTWGFPAISQFSSRVDYWANIYFDRNGRWPTASELVGWDVFQQSINTLASGTPYLPPVFTYNGTPYYNDPLIGPKTIGQGAVPEDFLRTAGGADMDTNELQFLMRFGQVSPNRQNIPAFDAESLRELLGNLSPVRARGSGGGGAGRSAITFDRNQLLESARDRWGGLMLETPDEIEGIVDQYIKEANSFWMNKGGQLDFDTYLVNQMRATPRYKTLYRRKQSFETEEEYMARYRGTVAQFGLNERATQRETTAGLRSGAGAAGFASRVSRTREAQLQPGFSQRLAQTVASLGPLAVS